jgi:hypothetical protein
LTTNIHVDCDSLWIYASEYGASVEARDDAIFSDALPRFLDLFKKHGVHATFFIVGRDLALPRCREFCRSAIDRGHRIANHTFSHLQDLHAIDDNALDWEIRRCHDELVSVTARAPVGLRLPGYYFDDRVVPIMQSLNYQYDSSILPGWGVYLMAAFYRFFNSAGQNKRFGRAWYPLARSRRHKISTHNGLPLWEFPLAICPLVRLPIHSTFVFSWGLAYFHFAYRLRGSLRLDTVLLFHAVDLLDEALAGELKTKIPTLQLKFETRHKMVERLVQTTSKNTQLTEEMLG